MVIGHLCGGISREGDEFRGGSGLAHNLLHQVYDRFKEAYGTVLCQDARKAGGGCPNVVGTAAKWAAEVILREFTDYVPEEPEDDKPEDAEEKDEAADK